LVSIHSSIYNSVYCLDLLKASEELTLFAEELASGREKEMSSVNLKEAKKLLEKAYNPNLSKEELEFHQKLLREIN
jgi:hypothetical protein